MSSLIKQLTHVQKNSCSSPVAKHSKKHIFFVLYSFRTCNEIDDCSVLERKGVKEEAKVKNTKNCQISSNIIPWIVCWHILRFPSFKSLFHLFIEAIIFVSFVPLDYWHFHFWKSWLQLTNDGSRAFGPNKKNYNSCERLYKRWVLSVLLTMVFEILTF